MWCQFHIDLYPEPFWFTAYYKKYLFQALCSCRTSSRAFFLWEQNWAPCRRSRGCSTPQPGRPVLHVDSHAETGADYTCYSVWAFLHGSWRLSVCMVCSIWSCESVEFLLTAITTGLCPSGFHYIHSKYDMSKSVNNWRRCFRRITNNSDLVYTSSNNTCPLFVVIWNLI